MNSRREPKLSAICYSLSVLQQFVDAGRTVCGKCLCNGRMSVCLSRRSTAAATCSWFAAYRLSTDNCRLPQPGRGRQISIDSSRLQNSGCGQRYCCDPRRIDASLFKQCYQRTAATAADQSAAPPTRCLAADCRCDDLSLSFNMAAAGSDVIASSGGAGAAAGGGRRPAARSRDAGAESVLCGLGGAGGVPSVLSPTPLQWTAGTSRCRSSSTIRCSMTM